MIFGKTIGSIRKYLGWVSRATTGMKKMLVAEVVTGIVKVVIGLLFIIESKRMIDIATGTTEGSLWTSLCLLAILLLGEIGAGMVYGYISTRSEIAMRNRMRMGYFSRLLLTPMYGRKDNHSGDLVTRIEDDVKIVTSTLTSSVPSFIITAVQFVGAFLLMLQLDLRIAIVVAAILPVFMIVGRLITQKLRTMTKEIRESESQVKSVVQESLQHSSNIRALECETSVEGKLDNLQSLLFGKTMRRTRFTIVSRTMLTTGFTAGYLTAFGWGCFQLEAGAITFGMMTAFLQLVAKIQRPTVDLAQAIPTFIHTTTSIDRLVEIEKMETEEKKQQVMFAGSPGIRFENVTFAYPGEEKMIHRSFSFDFKAGKSAAILGQTGGGKTTLIRLMLALLKPDSGKIIMYDNDRETEVTTGTRCNFAYVPQGNTLLSGTIRENLLLGNPKATDEDMKKALHTAAADFVFSLPEGIDTACGERGTGLSEGQAQRIAIARGLLRPGKILLLDEISSALDRETEELLFRRIKEEHGGKTVILITHRTGAAEHCDNIVNL